MKSQHEKVFLPTLIAGFLYFKTFIMGKLKKGTLLTAIDECTLHSGEGNALVIGREYRITFIDYDELAIISEVGYHTFDLDDSSKDYYGLYFKLEL